MVFRRLSPVNGFGRKILVWPKDCQTWIKSSPIARSELAPPDFRCVERYRGKPLNKLVFQAGLEPCYRRERAVHEGPGYTMETF
jgi:hypothetical protein